MSSSAKAQGGGAKPRLLLCYFEDQARPIGAGWRWVFVKEGRVWVFVLDPWNRYTVRLPRTHKNPNLGWQSVQTASEPNSWPFGRTDEVLKRAKLKLRNLIGPDPTLATKLELECLEL